jgi:hypothetical protein
MRSSRPVAALLLLGLTAHAQGSAVLHRSPRRVVRPTLHHELLVQADWAAFSFPFSGE